MNLNPTTNHVTEHTINHTVDPATTALQFYLPSQYDSYRQAIFDVIRIFLPRFQWTECMESENKEKTEGTAEEGRAAVQRITLEQDEQTWTLQMGADRSVFAVEGLDENQRRRILKQKVYAFMQQYTGQHVHPWGIMTGVRPTKIVHRCLDEGQLPETISRMLRHDYLMSDEKTNLLLDVTARQRPFLLNRQQAKDSVSIYLAIPFCPTRCAYCSFPSFCLPKPKLQEEYLNNLLAECKAVGEALAQQGKQIQTIYIGGGTPTSLSAVQIERLLSDVQRYLGSDKLKEFTVEAGRPDTITAEKLQLMHQYGAGRISINPQTFSQKTLDAIGRKHTVQQIYDVYHTARQIGFDSINMDLITGLTGETVDDFAHSLEQIARLQPENVTVHTLAIKRTARLQLDELSNQQSRVVEQMHRLMNQWLTTQPYVPYYLYRQKHMIGDQENTGYCLPGKESLYNIQMMEERQTIFGLGVGSTSKYVNTHDWTLTQSSNPKDLIFYNQRIDEIIQRKIENIQQME